MAKFIIGDRFKKVSERLPLISEGIWATETLLFGGMLKCLALLPPDIASGLGRQAGTLCGPHLKKQRIFKRNLAIAFPEKGPQEIERLSKKTWGNAGAILAEYPHLPAITQVDSKRLEIETPVPPDEFASQGKPMIFVGAHHSNWELAAAAIKRLGISLAVPYTPLGNPWMDHFLAEWRKSLGCELFARDESMRPLLSQLKGGKSIGLVMDQRVDNGEPIPFFGQDKWTSVVPARLALRYGYDLVPVRVQRTRGARYRVTFFPPIKPPKDHQDDATSARAMTAEINQLFEQWIRECPEDWFCSKRRWPKKVHSDTNPETREMLPSA